MYYEKNSIIKNIAFDNVDVKTCIKKTAHLKMKMKKTCIIKTLHLMMQMKKHVL